MNHVTVLLEHCRCWIREVNFLSSNKVHTELHSPTVSPYIYCVEMNMELWLSNWAFLNTFLGVRIVFKLLCYSECYVSKL